MIQLRIKSIILTGVDREVDKCQQLFMLKMVRKQAIEINLFNLKKDY